MQETMEALQASSSKMEEAEKEYKDKEEDVNAQARRVQDYETATKEANGISDKFDADIRDVGKKVAKLEVSRREENTNLKRHTPISI